MTSYAPALPPNLVPWAEIVPGMGAVTVDDLLTIPDDGYHYEVVDGVLVRIAGSGFDATRIALRLGARLLTYADDHRLGVVTGVDGVYRFSPAETGLLPDVGFIAMAKVGLITERSRPIPFAPDLAVEVASPDQKPAEMAAKARLYLSGGARLVWVVWPASEHIDVWHADHPEGPAATLNTSSTLDGEDVLPGFTQPVADVFADPLG